MPNRLIRRDDIPHWGYDLAPENRPGVPMERPPHIAKGVHWTLPERQRSDVEVLKRVGQEQLTPVFGTTLPPRGLSGAIKRFAYRIPEHRAPHFMLLLLSDRIDVLEHALEKPAKNFPWSLAAFGLLGALVVPAIRPRKNEPQQEPKAA